MLFRNVGLGQASVQDRTGALYFVLTSQIFSAQVPILSTGAEPLRNRGARMCAARRAKPLYQHPSPLCVTGPTARPQRHRLTVLVVALVLFGGMKRAGMPQASMRVFLEERDLFLRERLAVRPCAQTLFVRASLRCVSSRPRALLALACCSLTLRLSATLVRGPTAHRRISGQSRSPTRPTRSSGCPVLRATHQSVALHHLSLPLSPSLPLSLPLSPSLSLSLAVSTLYVFFVMC